MFYISILDPITCWYLLLGRFGDIKGIKISPNKPVNNTSIGNTGRRTIKSGGFWLSNGRIIEQLINGKILPECIHIFCCLKSTKIGSKCEVSIFTFFTATLTSLMNLSATPDWACSIVQHRCTQAGSWRMFRFQPPSFIRSPNP